MENIPFDWKKIRSVLVAVAAVLGLLLGVVNYVAGQLPSGDTQALGVTNFDDLSLSGELTAAGVNATTITATTIISQEVGFSGTTADLTGQVTAGSLLVGGGYGSTGCTLSAAGVLQCNGAATVDGATTSTGLLNANAGIAVDTSAFTVADTSGNTVIAGTLAANGGIAVDTSAFTVADTSGNVNTAGTLGIGGVTFSGPIKYGTAASYDQGAAITHGFATTPTVCFIGPVRDVTSTLTIGATTFSSDMATVAEPIYWFCGK